MFNNIVSESDTLVDDHLVQNAILKLAMIELVAPESKWRRGKRQAITDPERTTADRAKELFTRLSESPIRTTTDMGLDLREIAKDFLIAIKQRETHTKVDKVVHTKTQLIVAREIYHMCQTRSRFLHSAQVSSSSKIWKDYLKGASLADKRIWESYVENMERPAPALQIVICR